MTEPNLDELKQAVPLWRVAEERIPSLKREGNEWKGLCPFHQEKTPSFTIFQKDGAWLFKCFGCQETGNVFQLIQKMDKVPFKKAVETVAKMTEAQWEEGKQQVDRTFTPAIKTEKKLLTFPLSILAEAEKRLERSPQALEWLAGRGITLETAKRFHLGYTQNLQSDPNHPWANDGWLVFPTFTGDTITLIKYRSVKGKKTPDGKPAISRKKNMGTDLYNADAIQPFDDLFVVEGEPDCMVMAQAGFVTVSLPSAGFTPTPEMRDKMLQANAVFLAGDMDNVGQQTMEKLWTELRDRTYRVEWPEGCKDANDAFLKECGGNVEKFRALVENLRAKAVSTPMPFMFDLSKTMRHMDMTTPMENPKRLRFPWSDIDSWVAVLPGDVMCMFATESKTGKTTWLMGILLENAMKYGRVVVNYSAEVLPEQYARRAAAYITEKNRDKLTTEDFVAAAEEMEDARFYNGYKPGAKWHEVVELLNWAKRRLGADILVVDHLHFLTRSEKDETKAQSEFMRELKDLALEYRVIVIVVGQPRKAQASQRGREAVTQDAKGSEAFGSDASQVFILHRDRKPGDQQGIGSGDDIYEPITKVKLDYSRDSLARVTRLFFRGDICKFLNMTTQEPPNATPNP